MVLKNCILGGVRVGPLNAQKTFFLGLAILVGTSAYFQEEGTNNVLGVGGLRLPPLQNAETTSFHQRKRDANQREQDEKIRRNKERFDSAWTVLDSYFPQIKNKDALEDQTSALAALEALKKKDFGDFLNPHIVKKVDELTQAIDELKEKSFDKYNNIDESTSNTNDIDSPRSSRRLDSQEGSSLAQDWVDALWKVVLEVDPQDGKYNSVTELETAGWEMGEKLGKGGMGDVYNVMINGKVTEDYVLKVQSTKDFCNGSGPALFPMVDATKKPLINPKTQKPLSGLPTCYYNARNRQMKKIESITEFRWQDEEDIWSYINKPVFWGEASKNDSTHTFTILRKVRGQDLLKWVEDKKIPLQVSSRVFPKLHKGLSLLHSYGLVHTDLKPENVMVTNYESGSNRGQLDAVLIDFDFLAPADYAYAGAWAGTPGYIAGLVRPEFRVEDEEGYSYMLRLPALDYFSLGGIAMDLVTKFQKEKLFVSQKNSPDWHCTSHIYRRMWEFATNTEIFERCIKRWDEVANLKVDQPQWKIAQDFWKQAVKPLLTVDVNSRPTDLREDFQDLGKHFTTYDYNTKKYTSLDGPSFTYDDAAGLFKSAPKNFAEKLHYKLNLKKAAFLNNNKATGNNKAARGVVQRVLKKNKNMFKRRQGSLNKVTVQNEEQKLKAQKKQKLKALEKLMLDK